MARNAPMPHALAGRRVQAEGSPPPQCTRPSNPSNPCARNALQGVGSAFLRGYYGGEEQGASRNKYAPPLADSQTFVVADQSSPSFRDSLVRWAGAVASCRCVSVRGCI